MSPDESEVVEANAAFYRAFRARDVDGMEALWASRDGVAVIHPGWPALHGRDAVLESWRRILRSPSAPEIACAGARAYLMGETAFVICTEKLPHGDLIATNIFMREAGDWRLVHHQAGPTPQEEDEAPPEVIH